MPRKATSGLAAATMQRKKAVGVMQPKKVLKAAKYEGKMVEREMSMKGMVNDVQAVPMKERLALQRLSTASGVMKCRKVLNAARYDSNTVEGATPMKLTVNDAKVVAVMTPSVIKRPSSAVPKQRSRVRPLLSVSYMIEQAIDFVEHAFRCGRLHRDDAYIILVELAAASKLASEGKVFGESATHKVRASRMISRVMARRRAGRHGCCHGA